MRFFAPLLLAATAADAHYTFSALIDGDENSGDWGAVRKTINWQNLGPVTDVTSRAIRCYELNPGKGADKIVNATAGQTLAFQANPDIYHPGPLSFYMAKVPEGQTAATFDGEGAVWFKIWEEHPTFAPKSMTWSSHGLKKPSVTIPKCLSDGDYLLRIEQIGLHVAQSKNGAQFYISCGQIYLTGGDGTGKPTDLVSFPGAYKNTDPGILIDIYWPVPTSYKNPGPSVFSC